MEAKSARKKSQGNNFLITVHHQENYSWQGSIQWIDTGEKIHFRSELEMITLMNEAIKTNQNNEEHVRNWSNSKKVIAG